MHRNHSIVSYCVCVVTLRGGQGAPVRGHEQTQCVCVILRLGEMDLQSHGICCEAARCLSQTEMSGWNFECLCFGRRSDFQKVLTRRMIRRIVLNFHVDRACFRGGDAAKSFG